MSWSEEEFQKQLLRGDITLHESSAEAAPWLTVFDEAANMDESVEVDYFASLRGRANRATGVHTETMVQKVLIEAGFRMVTKVENTWRVVKVIKRMGSRLIAEVVPAAIEGDYRAIEPSTGRSVLVEVKARKDKLQHGNLKDHQVESLDEHFINGGISLLAWVDTGQPDYPIYLMMWPVPGFIERTSLTAAIIEERGCLWR